MAADSEAVEAAGETLVHHLHHDMEVVAEELMDSELEMVAAVIDLHQETTDQENDHDHGKLYFYLRSKKLENQKKTKMEKSKLKNLTTSFILAHHRAVRALHHDMTPIIGIKRFRVIELKD